MMATLAWKEYREHRGVWLTMAAVACLGLFGLSRLVSAGGTPGAHALVTVVSAGWLLAWGYGLVCGAMLLAGEREDGTLTFLDGLPRLRRQVWTAKCLIGVGLVLGQAVVLTAVTLGLNVLDGARDVAAAGTAFTYAGLTGLGWGLLFSASGQHVLRVIAEAIGAQILTAFGLLLLTVSFPHQERALVLSLAGLTVLAFAGSWRIFSRPDRLRRARAPRVARQPSWPGLLWLCRQQMGSFALVLLPCSVAAGLLVMTAGAFLWPATTLLVGVLCGVTVFADEQSGGSFRFLGDQRLPPGRVWLAKVGMRLALAVVSALLLVAPSLVRSLVFTAETTVPHGPRTFLGWLLRDPVVGELAAPGAFLALWLLHGFAFGQLCGLLVRKSVVAAFLALGASALAASAWLPSLAGGGLHFWQVAGVPVLALAASRLLFPAWTAGRLAGARLAGGVAAFTAAALLWTAAGLAFRVAEIPDTPDLMDLPAFLAELPAASRNESGELTRRACEDLSARLREQSDRRPTKPLFPHEKGKLPDDRPHPAQRQRESFEGQAGEVLERGWPAGEPELGAWLDSLFAGRWPDELARAAALPVGVVVDPRKLTMGSPLRELEPARAAGLLLSVHGLRAQARGDDAAFVADLRAGLALSRNLRNHSVLIAVLVARSIEERLLAGLDRWLERLHGRPDLLREALTVLQRHEALLPDDPTDTQRAEFLVAENTLRHPEDWLAQDLRPSPSPSSPALLAAVAVAWQVPWEHERQQRLLRLQFAGGTRTAVVLRAAPWMRELPAGVRLSEESDRQRREWTELRARQLEVALRLYQAERGKPAASLEALVPGILPEVPLDPFASRPFRYRLSAGERIEWPGTDPEPPGRPGVNPVLPATRPVPAGQGILWSVGKDGFDDGGRRQGLHVIGLPAADLIFLVPLPPEK